MFRFSLQEILRWTCKLKKKKSLPPYSFKVVLEEVFEHNFAPRTLMSQLFKRKVHFVCQITWDTMIIKLQLVIPIIVFLRVEYCSQLSLISFKIESECILDCRFSKTIYQKFANIRARLPVMISSQLYVVKSQGHYYSFSFCSLWRPKSTDSVRGT